MRFVRTNGHATQDPLRDKSNVSRSFGKRTRQQPPNCKFRPWKFALTLGNSFTQLLCLAVCQVVGFLDALRSVFVLAGQDGTCDGEIGESRFQGTLTGTPHASQMKLQCGCSAAVRRLAASCGFGSKGDLCTSGVFYACATKQPQHAFRTWSVSQTPTPQICNVISQCHE